jgi:hypothetical protein
LGLKHDPKLCTKCSNGVIGQAYPQHAILIPEGALLKPLQQHEVTDMGLWEDDHFKWYTVETNGDVWNEPPWAIRKEDIKVQWSLIFVLVRCALTNFNSSE